MLMLEEKTITLASGLSVNWIIMAGNLREHVALGPLPRSSLAREEISQQ
jgi:hypothetical protein